MKLTKTPFLNTIVAIELIKGEINVSKVLYFSISIELNTLFIHPNITYNKPLIIIVIPKYLKSL